MRLSRGRSARHALTGVFWTDLKMISLARKRLHDAAVPPTTLIYAVGDIHGRLDLLDRLLAWVVEDARAAGPEVNAQIIFLGDYVDRGPDSMGVLERLSSLCVEGLSVTTLKGNHEQMMLEILDSPEKWPGWARAGGLATVVSYGVRPPPANSPPEAVAEMVEALRAAVPQKHRDFLDALRPALEVGDFFFAHAGVRPGRPLRDQVEQDLLWIREGFLNHKGPFERVIVHGHSTDTTPMVDDYRIGVDTGAYATGVLTCVRIHGRRKELIGVNLGGVWLWS